MSNVSFEYSERETGGSKYPTRSTLTAIHPEHGQVGSLTYWPPRRSNGKLKIDRLEVDPEHRRQGHGTALMNELQTRHPKASIDHGDRTNDGKAWWSSYGQGADSRGRTAAREPGSTDCWVCGGAGDEPGEEGSECSACDGSGYLTLGEQRRWTCPEGAHIVKHPSDGYQHHDGSIGCENGPVAELVRARTKELVRRKYRNRGWTAAFRPDKRIFGPTYGLDHRLFTGEQLKPEVREHVMGTLDWFWTPIYGSGWHNWAKVYFAGSEASEWTAANLEGNNDFDVLIGIDYDSFRRDQNVSSSNEAITEVMNGQFKSQLDPLTEHTMIVVDGMPQGPFENTWYVNADSWDIRDIRPYAAYNVSDDTWAVKPPHLPDWSIDQFPEGPALAQLGEAVSGAIKAVLALPEPYRTQQAVAWWDHLHGDRSRAFTPQGEGWYDPSNVIEKWLSQEGLWDELAKLVFAVRENPHLLDAPANWSNDPTSMQVAR